MFNVNGHRLFRELFTYQIPIVLPALGPVVGGFYSLVFVVTAVFKILLIAVASKIFLEGNSCKAPETRSKEKVPLKKAFERAFKKEFRLFLKIAGVYLVATTVIFILQEQGAFEIFSVLPLAEIFSIPPETMSRYKLRSKPFLVISLMGPCPIRRITEIQAMIVLMLGSMFMLPIFAVRSQLPRKVAIFGTRLGVQIVAYSTAISILVRLVILLILLSMVS
jgi:hypothetical protein